jgi:hypothetical protein
MAICLYSDMINIWLETFLLLIPHENKLIVNLLIVAEFKCWYLCIYQNIYPNIQIIYCRTI